jgi:hypothetical protein
MLITFILDSTVLLMQSKTILVFVGAMLLSWLTIILFYTGCPQTGVHFWITWDIYKNTQLSGPTKSEFAGLEA